VPSSTEELTYASKRARKKNANHGGKAGQR